MFNLTITTETYTRTDSGKSWRSKPDSTETTDPMPWRDLGQTTHRNITSDDTLRFFRRLGGSETAIRSYTSAGYIVTRLISTSPDRQVRKVRRFTITDAND